MLDRECIGWGYHHALCHLLRYVCYFDIYSVYGHIVSVMLWLLELHVHFSGDVLVNLDLIHQLDPVNH